ncbi:MAG: hypothetical protein GY820_20010 [Gammaproteobacteria bacterium]|nr:hypothetical protein [Gammaproteobacteria bacterium]
MLDNDGKKEKVQQTNSAFEKTVKNIISHHNKRREELSKQTSSNENLIKQFNNNFSSPLTNNVVQDNKQLSDKYHDAAFNEPKQDIDLTGNYLSDVVSKEEIKKCDKIKTSIKDQTKKAHAKNKQDVLKNIETSLAKANILKENKNLEESFPDEYQQVLNEIKELNQEKNKVLNSDIRFDGDTMVKTGSYLLNDDTTTKLNKQISNINEIEKSIAEKHNANLKEIQSALNELSSKAGSLTYKSGFTYKASEMSKQLLEGFKLSINGEYLA